MTFDTRSDMLALKPDLGCLLPANVLSKDEYPRYCWRGACGTLLPLCHAAAWPIHGNLLTALLADSRKGRCKRIGIICCMIPDEFERPLELTL